MDHDKCEDTKECPVCNHVSNKNYFMGVCDECDIQFCIRCDYGNVLADNTVLIPTTKGGGKRIQVCNGCAMNMHLLFQLTKQQMNIDKQIKEIISK